MIDKIVCYISEICEYDMSLLEEYFLYASNGDIQFIRGDVISFKIKRGKLIDSAKKSYTVKKNEADIISSIIGCRVKKTASLLNASEYESVYNLVNKRNLIAIPLLCYNESIWLIKVETDCGIAVKAVLKKLVRNYKFLYTLLTTQLKRQLIEEELRSVGAGLLSNIVEESVISILGEDKLPDVYCINHIASMKYEGATNLGVINFVDDEISVGNITFLNACAITDIEARKMRKYLQMSNEKFPLIAKYNNDYLVWSVSGLGDSSSKFKYQLSFFKNNSWVLRSSYEEIKYKDGVFSIAKINKSVVAEYYFHGMFTGKEKTISKIINIARKQKHGTTLIFIDDDIIAKEEVKRLSSVNRAIEIESNNNMDKYLLQLSSIDGALILSSDGYCHGVGVILDGVANVPSNRGRGARYTSACTYIADKAISNKETNHQYMAVVISEDGSCDILCSNYIKYDIDYIPRRLIERELRNVLEQYRSAYDYMDDGRIYNHVLCLIFEKVKDKGISFNQIIDVMNTFDDGID